MEIIVAALVLLFAVAYAVTIAVNVEKGKNWALEIARAMSMLDPQSVSYELRCRAMEAPESESQPLDRSEPEIERLAA